MCISRHILVCRRCYFHECLGIQEFLRSPSCFHAFMCSVQDEGGAPDFSTSFVQAASAQHTAKLPQDPTLPASLELGPSSQAMVKIQRKGPHASAKSRPSKETPKMVKRQLKFLKHNGEKHNMSRDDKTISDLMEGLHIDQADIIFFY